MPRVRHEESFEAAGREIKEIARRLMVENGTEGLTIRGIAKELGKTPPAVYTYFPSLDDLITALIADAFNALADALETARDSVISDNPVEKLTAVLMAYRGWSVEFPMDFQLIYGSPIHGYKAPREMTVPAVIRGFAVIVGLIEAIIQLDPSIPHPPYRNIPSSLEATIQGLIARDRYPISAHAMYLGFIGWTTLHGIIMLELFNHLQPVLGDVETYYREQMLNMMRAFGVKV